MTTSCELKRSSAYSEDLRWRMVYQRHGLRLPYAEIAVNLSVDRSTLKRIVKLFNDTGNVAKKPYNKSDLPRKVTKVVEMFILQLVLQCPGIMLNEITTEVNSVLKLDLHESTICRFLHSQGFTRQKMQIIAKQRDELDRAKYVTELSVYKPEMLVFLDETGCDRRNVLRRYAYSLRGKPARSHKLLVRGKRRNAIAFMSVAGILDCHIASGSVDSDIFYSCVQKYLLPHLMPFNGTNSHSVVIMDNASIHHVEEVTEMIHSVGALVLFLPPYSPDYNPIEEAFSKVKYLVKQYESDPEMEEMDIESILLAAFSAITQEDCINWVENCGIYMK